MKFYITTAIPYVNAAPHIGHALEFVQGDVIARYHKLKGDEVKLLTGADENALKIVQAAEKAGQTPKELTDYNSQVFQDLASSLDVHFDVFQRGTDKEHHFLASQELWKRCLNNGDIYKKEYQGLYCVGCETFYTKDELTDEEGLCPEHLKKPELVREENYFFKLSRYQDKILELIENGSLKIIPEFRKNEVVSFIKQGLADFSVSRSRERAKGWGVPVPNDPDQIIYVWFDALNIYQSGVGFAWDEKSYQKWWPAEVHLIGKGIIRFHAVYWPAILLSAKLKLPKTILAHGYITVEGQKMSKTLGNVIDPFTLIKKYGSEAIRYYLLREIPTFSDGDYSENRFKEIFNADLANNLGNLIARSAKLLEINKTEIKADSISEFTSEVKKHLENYQLDKALEVIWKKIKELNIYINTKKPWEKSGEQKEETWIEIIKGIRQIAYDLQPFLPKTAEIIRKQFKEKIIKPQKPLFPRIK